MKKKDVKKAVKKAMKKAMKKAIQFGLESPNPYIFDPKKPRTAFTPPSSLERARTSRLENSIVRISKPTAEEWLLWAAENDIDPVPSEPVINFWDEFKPVFDADGQRIDRAAVQSSLNQMFDVKVRLEDTPLPEGSVVILTGESK